MNQKKSSQVSVLTLIASSRQDESDRAIFLLLVLRVWWEGLGTVVEWGGVLVAGANHGACVPHGWSWGLVLDLPIIGHLQLSCSRAAPAQRHTNHREGRLRGALVGGTATPAVVVCALVSHT